MALSLRRYRKSLLATGLISPAELAAFERGLPRAKRPKAADELARLLVEAGKITEFQAGEIGAGRTTELVLGNYVVLDRIGAGGMGQVFKAWHRRMERVVALKTLPDQRAAGEDSVARFRREVLSAARLSHANIVAAYDADVAQGIHFLVMEYVDGPNLSEVVRQHGPLPVADAVRHVLDAARGLAYAHSQGIIHRDIKPSNLIVDRSGIVKVLDLGLARMPAVAAGAELTLPGDVVGTLEYMAPEQAAGSRQVDARADIYGLGCTLFRLIAGEFPYPGRSPQEIIAAHRDQKIPSLRALREEVPRSLDAIFKKLAAKDPSQRPQSMEEVIAAFERLRFVERRFVGSPPGGRLGDRLTPERSESGDDLELAPTFAGEAPAAAAIAVEPVAPAGSRADESSTPASTAKVSPRTAIVTLAGALTLIAGLSWLESVRVPGPPTHPDTKESIYQVAQEDARQWSESLGVPLRMTNTLGMQFILIPPSHGPDESVRAVRTPFYLSVYELTAGQVHQFLAARGYATSAARGWEGDRHPATALTASDAEAFCRWLSDRERASYRLPTDAEWSHACAAGAATRCWFDENESLDRYAWYEANAAGRTHQVGLLEANPFGLHDILGNAAEWCVSGNGPRMRHVLCGGCWSSAGAQLAPGAIEAAGVHGGGLGGVRLVLDLPSEARWPGSPLTP
ncbi:MAG TPA: bifunctional serine/threonine-protein kinase/formylglycine-generating enzyme family protein [Pirellulales bacterium]|nr:bifunctional serine/threonine-protein kinase/formylglycine-generating enzyme family protein [Pirellulales bacterium]